MAYHKNIIQGYELLLFDEQNRPLAMSRNCAIAFNLNLQNVTNKESLGWKQLMPNLKSWSIEFEGLVSFDEGFTFSYFFNKYKSKAPFIIAFGTQNESFEFLYNGMVAIEKIDQTASYDDLVSFSGTLRGIGNVETSIRLSGGFPYIIPFELA